MEGHCTHNGGIMMLMPRNIGRIVADVAYCYRSSSVLCWSVCHYSEPCKKGWTNRDAI